MLEDAVFRLIPGFRHRGPEVLVHLYQVPLCVLEAIISLDLALSAPSFEFGAEVLRPRGLFGGHVEAVHSRPDTLDAVVCRLSEVSGNEQSILSFRNTAIQVFVVPSTIGIKPCHLNNTRATSWYVVRQSVDIPKSLTLRLRAS